MSENKMGTMKIGKLVMNMSLPMMASMIIQALYNIVDSMFVSRLSEDALTAVSLAFPMQTLLIAFGTGVGVGMNALLSKALGERDRDRANKMAKNGIFLMLMNFMLFVLVGIFAVKPFMRMQTGAADGDIYNYGVQYLTIVCTFSFGIFGQVISERLLQATGRTFYSMITQAIGAVTNIILDPIFIFGLFGMPRLEVAGAAIATVIGQILAAAAGLILNFRVNKEIELNFRGFRPDFKAIKRIYAIGLPTIIMQAIGSVMTYCMNLILMGFTSTATAVFGIYHKLQSFAFMPLFGLNNGMVPIIAYNYGAGKRSRIMKTYGFGLIVGEIIMLTAFALFQLVPDRLLGLFEASGEMLKIGVPALRIIGIHYLIAGFCIISSSALQALGNGVYSMIVSIMRQVVALLPAAYILSRIGGLSAVWWAFPIAEFISLIATTCAITLIYKKVIKNVPDNV